jgi:thymidylate synthase
MFHPSNRRKQYDGYYNEEYSRNGPVVSINVPVCVTYERPTERVLFHPGRDCNPFFHIVESMWMLAGMNNLGPLVHYVSNFGDYSDDNETLNGAYGYRWRNGVQRPGFSEAQRDQLNILVEHLKSTPNSRRAVLQMWNVEDDLLKIDSSKDVCCNLSVCFSIRKESQSEGEVAVYGEDPGSLDMTVFNRSNDAIWGLAGANAVHFSFLQEYIATRLQMNVGKYHQITNNLHVYTKNQDFDKWSETDIDHYMVLEQKEQIFVPLLVDDETFLKEIRLLLGTPYDIANIVPTEPFLLKVVHPMMHAYNLHKKRRYDESMFFCQQILAPDWRKVAIEWIQRREAKWLQRKS